MKRSLSFAALAALVGLAGSVYGQQLAVAGSPVAKDVPGAKELPDPNRMYKVVFDIGKAAAKKPPIYGTKRKTIATMPHRNGLGTPMNASPVPTIVPNKALSHVCARK